MILRLAWRETRALTGRYLFFILSVAVGVAAVVGVKGFAYNLNAALQREARTLLAGDLQVSLGREPTAAQAAVFDGLAGRGIRATAVTEMSTITASPGTAGTSLVELKAVDPAVYPFYGTVQTQPQAALAELLGRDTVLVAPDVLPRLGVGVGDSLKLGSAVFRIAGLVEKEPDRIASGFSLGPRVMLSQAALARTGLGGFGARARYAYLVQLPPEADAAAVTAELEQAFGERHATVRHYTDAQPRLRGFLSRLTNFLGLVSVIALLVGGLGVAHTTRVFLQQKLDTVAVLKCLGATSRTITAVYVTQAVLLGLLGGLVGAGMGALAQAALPRLLGPLLELDLAIAPDPLAVAQGLAAGLLVAGLFALVPLAGIGRVPAARIFRRDMAEAGGAGARLRQEELLASALALGGLAVIAAWLAGSWLWAAYFLAGLTGATLALAGVAWLVLRGIRRLPRPGSLAVRHGLGGLYRPGSQAVPVVLALGVGVTAVTAVYLLQGSLLQQVVSAQPGGSPNMIFIGIQPAQRDDFAAFLHASPAVAEVAEVTPMVPGRLLTVAGLGPDEKDLSEGDRQFWTRQFMNTWSAGLPPGDKVVEGRWWEPADYAAGPLVSVEREAATRLGIRLGDTIEFDVDGAVVAARVHNMREADWNNFRTNFFVVFSPGALDGFTTTYAALARTAPGGDGQLLRQLVDAFPGVTGLNVRDILDTVQSVLDRIGLVIRFVAGFAILAGLVILAGSVAATKFRRMREAAVLRALGATPRVVGGILATEYLVLGAVAGAVGVVLAHALAAVALHYLFAAPPVVSLPVLAGGPLLTAALTLGAGWAASLDILRQPPLAVLRND